MNEFWRIRSPLEGGKKIKSYIISYESTVSELFSTNPTMHLADQWGRKVTGWFRSNAGVEEAEPNLG